MSWFSKPKPPRPAPGTGPTGPTSEQRMQAWEVAMRSDGVPDFVRARLSAAAERQAPWMSTMTPAELLLMRTHGLRPIAAISGTCWMQLGFAPTRAYEMGIHAAFERLVVEARVCGANAVVDVELRATRGHLSGMDFTLIGTAVRVEGLPPSENPIVATTSALEFVRLLEADIVPVGVAIGTHSSSITDSGKTMGGSWTIANQNLSSLGTFWESIRRGAHQELKRHAAEQGNGVLAHTHFGQILKVEGGDQNPDRYIARHIVLGTVVDTKKGAPFPHDIETVIDMRDGISPLLHGDRPRARVTNNESEVR